MSCIIALRKGGEAVVVLYADQLFLENLIVDYILLLATAKLTGITARRTRMGLAAGLGALYGVFALIAGGFFTSWAVKITVGVVMVMIVFGSSSRLLRLILIFFGVSAAFAGAVMASAFIRGEDPSPLNAGDVSFSTLLLAFAAAFALFSGAFRAVTRHRLRGEIDRLTVTFNGVSVRVPALTDTGNDLAEPVSGLPVAVCSLEALAPLFSDEVLEILRSAPDAPAALERLYDRGIFSFRLVPYRAVGKKEGMLPAFRPDSLRRGGRELTAFVAVDRAGMESAAGYSAIVGV